MIILITFKDEKSGLLCVSHGYNVGTDETVTLPQYPLSSFSYRFDSEVMEYILN